MTLPGLILKKMVQYMKKNKQMGKLLMLKVILFLFIIACGLYKRSNNTPNDNLNIRNFINSIRSRHGTLASYDKHDKTFENDDGDYFISDEISDKTII